MMQFRERATSACIVLLFSLLSPSGLDAPRLTVPPKVLDGASLQIEVSCLTANEVVRLHTIRQFEKWQNDKGTWKQVKVMLHAWAEYKADDKGKVQPHLQSPLPGI